MPAAIRIAVAGATGRVGGRDDSVPAIRSWIERSAARLPGGFAYDVRSWLLTLLDGDQRSRPRHIESLYVYFLRFAWWGRWFRVCRVSG